MDYSPYARDSHEVPASYYDFPKEIHSNIISFNPDLARSVPFLSTRYVTNIRPNCDLPISLKEIESYLISVRPKRIGLVMWKGMEMSSMDINSEYLRMFPYPIVEFIVYERGTDGVYRSANGHIYDLVTDFSDTTQSGRPINITAVNSILPDSYTMLEILRRRISCVDRYTSPHEFALKAVIDTMEYLKVKLPPPMMMHYIGIGHESLTGQILIPIFGRPDPDRYSRTLKTRLVATAGGSYPSIDDTFIILPYDIMEYRHQVGSALLDERFGNFGIVRP